MTIQDAPKARHRSRSGMLPLDWKQAPTVDDMWPDRVQLRVNGGVSWPDGCSFHDYLTAITQRSAFKDKPSVGRSYRGEILYGSVWAEVRINMVPGHRADERRAGEARITLDLGVNPTRTCAQARRRNSQPLDQLGLRAFFKPVAGTDEAFDEGYGLSNPGALDQNDNLFWNAFEAGGSTPAPRARTRDEFLVLFEERLRELVEHLLTSSATASDDAVPLEQARLQISWHDMRVTYAEVYAERATDDPIEIMHRLHDRGLSLAREIRASKFTGQATKFTYEAREGFSHIVVPLTPRANFDLSVYAKTLKRVRFEVRYHREFSHIVKKAAGERRFSTALNLLMTDAAARLPWTALGRAAEASSPTGRNEVIDLMIALHSATRANPDIFPDLVKQLIRTGGVYDTGAEGMGKAIKALVNAGVLEHWLAQKRERRAGRRYGLTPKYFDARLAVLASFGSSSANDEGTGAAGEVAVDRLRPSLRTYADDIPTLHRRREILRRNGLSE